jgi:hypothetical protein
MRSWREPDAGDPHVRFDERRLETELWEGLRHRHEAKAAGNSDSPFPMATAPVVDSTEHSVMISALREKYGSAFDLVHETMLVIDSTRPIAREAVFEGLRFAESLKRRAGDVLDQVIDPLEELSIGALPIEVVVPGVFRKDDLHSISSFSEPRPDSSSAMDSSRRRAFLGLRSKYAVSSRAW